MMQIRNNNRILTASEMSNENVSKNIRISVVFVMRKLRRYIENVFLPL